MSKKKILVQIDADANPSVFDSVVALDSGVDQLLPHGNVDESNVTGLVHGCIFTRGVSDLKSTAIFFGGSNVIKTEATVECAKNAFFGPMRVSLMSDPNGCNTTAAAAVISAGQHIEWQGATVTILAATGPVGLRIAQMLAREAAQLGSSINLRICSRKIERAVEVCELVSEGSKEAICQPIAVPDSTSALSAIQGSDAVFAAGAAGVELLASGWQEAKPQVVIDVNAVPPAGIHGVEVFDQGKVRGETICYGAIGVGGLKMKIHRQCIKSLFDSNDKTLETHEIHEIGKSLIGEIESGT